jgi:AcrR family transcriptional regulator
MTDVKSRRAEYASLTREAVLDGARTLFVEQGFDATSVDDIAQLSRVSKGAVYHHFADKRELFAELFRMSQVSVLERVAKAALAATGPWEQARVGAITFLRSYTGDEVARALLRQAVAVLGQQRSRDLDEEIALPLVCGLLTELRDLGELQPVPIPLTARILFSTLCEAATSVAMAPDAIDTAGQVEEVVLCLLSGLRRNPDLLA